MDSLIGSAIQKGSSLTQTSRAGSVGQACASRQARARLRILVVGGGIAGLTLAALLEQRGEHPVVIERNAEQGPGGYMLGLLPLGGRVLHGLDLHDAYLRRSSPMHAYEFYDRHGRLLRRFSLDRIIERFGAYQGVERGVLIDVLRQRIDSAAVHFESRSESLSESADAVEVRFNDGSRAEFDVVVGADGLHSATRRQAFDESLTAHWSTGWGGWVHWVEPLKENDSTYRELWSTRWGVGLYPVRDRLGVFLAGCVDDLRGRTAAEHGDAVTNELPGGPFRDAMKRIDRSGQPFFWKMEDRRAKYWHTGRVVLLGDAAAAFLPTAGVGASIAMDSAAALADELSRADASHIRHALSLFEKRQRRRVERAQKNSRQLAKLMFVDSPLRTLLRDQVMRFYSLDRLVASITAVMTGS